MALNLNRFNKIIDLTFYTSAGGRKVIRCPRNGQKPNIEINGTYTDRGYLRVFNITVKNLYLDLQTDQYAKIQVEAGYEGNTVTIDATILSIYQEAPGPEGKTVIQCQTASLQNWLDATVDLNYPAGTSINEILEQIKTKLGATQVKAGMKARALITKEPFMHEGSARGALEKLEIMFQEEKLVLFMNKTTLYAELAGAGDFTGIKVMKYMSAPPQPNTGGKDGTYYTTVTGPWMPDLNLYDKLQIPSKVYMLNFGMVGTGTTQNIQVSKLSFHFATTGNINSMTVQGSLAN